jgi:hypothetical protein
MRLPQRDLHKSLRTEALANHQRIATLVRPLDPERLVRRPPQGGWSVGEVLEHLCVVDERYRKPLTALIANARPDAAAPAREWKSSFFGNFIATALERPRKMRTSGSFKPGKAPRNGVVEDFLQRDSWMLTQMDDASSLDWRALHMASPAIPLPVIRMNLGDVFRIRVVHVKRHLGQMERVVKSISA